MFRPIFRITSKHTTPPGIFLRCFFVTALAMLAACEKSPTKSPAHEPTTIILSTNRHVLTKVGEQIQITATVLDRDSKVISDAAFIWRSADSKTATVDTTGMVTAVSNGTTQITVFSGYASASATVSVEQRAGSVEITPPALTLKYTGQTGQLLAIVKDNGNSPIPDAPVVWSSSHLAVATVNADGLVTAVSNGSAQISATSGDASASTAIVVELAAFSMTVTPETATLGSVGATAQFEAAVYDSAEVVIPDATVAWSSSERSVATVNGDGMVTAISNGTAQISATSGDISASATIVVEQAAYRIAIMPETATLRSVGSTVQLEAVVYDMEGAEIPDATVAWSSSERSVATVNADGVVTAVSNGSAQISATLGDVTVNAAIVVEQTAYRIAITPTTATLKSVGATVLLEAVVYDMEGAVIPGAQVAWSSGERSVATVNAEGVVTAVSNGTAQINATSGEVSANTTIVVEQAAYSIAITPETATLGSVGATIQFEAVVYDMEGAEIPEVQVAWSSSERSVATVNTDGVVTAVSNGSAQISATSGDASANATIVVEQTAFSIAITPETATLGSVGATIQFEAVVYDSAEVVIPDAPVTWSSNETRVATVDIAGLATSVGDGTATITARSGESSGTAMLTVTLPPPPAPPPAPPSTPPAPPPAPPSTPSTPPAPPPTVSDLRVFTFFMSNIPVPGSGIPGFVRPGTTIELTPWVINDGPESSPSTRIRCYYSVDKTITPSDTEVLNFSVPGLSVSERYSEAVSTMAPSTAGTYYYGACVDKVAGESNTSNNCSLPLILIVK